MTEISVAGLDREEALLLYKGKMYIDGNHQFAFERALRDEGKALGYNLETDIDEVAKLTNKLSSENEICTLDLYTDGAKLYLISHFKENLMLNLDYLKEYASARGYNIGYFKDFNGDDCILL